MAIFENNFIKSITSVSEALPHGQRISHAIIEYDRDIVNSSLSTETYTVKDRTITRVYSNTEPAKAAEGRDGRYVIVELSLYDAASQLFTTVRDDGIGITSGMSATAPAGPGPGPRGPGGPGRRGPLNRPKVIVAENRLSLFQTGEIMSVEGKKIPAFNGELASRFAVNEVVDDFKTFFDAEIPYNLYIPENYDPAKKYPMLVFVADASVVGVDPRLTLVQGNGATSFARPEAQKKHPCFVLAPQVSRRMEPSQNRAELATIVIDIIEKVCKAYSVDKNRIYTTGQSLGCINAFASAVEFPHYFAAYLCVGGQWEDTASLRHMKDDNLWMLNSDGDARAYPGMNAIYDELIAAGAEIERAEYDAKWPKAELEAAAEKTANSGKHILYSTFINQSVVPDGVAKSPVANHMNTWPVAYGIEAVHDWLFRQRKED